MGKNVIAVWGQFFHGQNVNQGMVDQRGIALAMKMRDADGAEQSLVTDGNWRGAMEDQDGWETPGFDDTAFVNRRRCILPNRSLNEFGQVLE